MTKPTSTPTPPRTPPPIPEASPEHAPTPDGSSPPRPGNPRDRRPLRPPPHHDHGPPRGTPADRPTGRSAEVHGPPTRPPGLRLPPATPSARRLRLPALPAAARRVRAHSGFDPALRPNTSVRSNTSVRPRSSPRVPSPPQRKSGRSTAVLIVVALVVALAAGASVFALMKGDGERPRAGGDPSTSPTPSAHSDPGTDHRGPLLAVADHARGDTDGRRDPRRVPRHMDRVHRQRHGPQHPRTHPPAGRGGRHGPLAHGGRPGGQRYVPLRVPGGALREAPSAGGSLRIGPSEVTVGQPATSCSPGSATELTVLPDGRLRRVNTSNSDELTYTKQG
jgi:hypothetical protein